MTPFLIAVIAMPLVIAAYLVFTFKCGGVNPPFDEWDYPDDSPSEGDEE